LFEIVKKHHEVFGVDIDLTAPRKRCDIMHICFPFRDQTFVGEVVEYIGRYQPALAIVNSTVAPGTSRRIAEESGMAVVNSRVRGKHAGMREEMLHYTKFIGALDLESGARAAQRFESVGIKSKVLGSPETTEIAKLTETTYFGVLIAWAQEVEAIVKRLELTMTKSLPFMRKLNSSRR
jgi:UDP-N-acetyl-D-mannosaminuronate dehydrogenase